MVGRKWTFKINGNRWYKRVGMNVKWKRERCGKERPRKGVMGSDTGRWMIVEWKSGKLWSEMIESVDRYFFAIYKSKQAAIFFFFLINLFWVLLFDNWKFCSVVYWAKKKSFWSCQEKRERKKKLEELVKGKKVVLRKANNRCSTIFICFSFFFWHVYNMVWLR